MNISCPAASGSNLCLAAPIIPRAMPVFMFSVTLPRAISPRSPRMFLPSSIGVPVSSSIFFCTRSTTALSRAAAEVIASSVVAGGTAWDTTLPELIRCLSDRLAPLATALVVTALRVLVLEAALSMPPTPPVKAPTPTICCHAGSWSNLVLAANGPSVKIVGMSP